MNRVIVQCAIVWALLVSTGLGETRQVPTHYATIQAAIDACVTGDVVLIAPGTYMGEGNRDIDFKGKAITVRGAAGPKSCIIDCNATREDHHRGFLFRSGETADSVLQGLSIRNGYSNKGGGVFCDASSPTILNCIITHCTVYGGSSGWGAGIYCYESHALIRDCTLSENIAQAANLLAPVTGLGGGIYCAKGAVTIVDCAFRDNEEDWSGAIHCKEDSSRIYGCTFIGQKGIFCTQSNARIEDCSITCYVYGIICERNDAAIIENCLICGHKPYGVRCLLSSPTIRRCAIAGNGIGVSLYDSGNPTIDNCTITGNAGEGLVFSGYRCTISNSIFWNNQSPYQIAVGSYSLQTSVCRVSYSSVQGGEKAIRVGDKGTLEWGSGNIDVDPCFADSGHWKPDPNSPPPSNRRDGGGGQRFIWVDGDYHLKSQAGRWDPVSKNWVKDDATSPCIDAGDPNSPVGEEPFPNAGRINMGAYGGTGEASKSYFGEPVCETVIPGDINGDCKVDFKDLTLMAMNWLGGASHGSGEGPGNQNDYSRAKGR
jgi:parallel beta-helix repeat protein